MLKLTWHFDLLVQLKNICKLLFNFISLILHHDNNALNLSKIGFWTKGVDFAANLLNNKIQFFPFVETIFFIGTNLLEKITML